MKKRHAFSISVAKPDFGTVNEDAAIYGDSVVAVSDGAGGGGLYADEWSAYLLQNLPEEPIVKFCQLDSWLDGIWETFYNGCEDRAKKEGGLVLDKFYSEGSYATIAAIWKSEKRCYWMTYGDSVAFHYNKRTKVLEHSFTRLADFNNPPYLINCKDPLNETGFRNGVFDVDYDSVLFCATDALAHFILMTYEIEHMNIYYEELIEAINAATKNSVCVNNAMAKPIVFSQVVNKLCQCSPYNSRFKNYVRRMLDKKMLVLDDYSYALMR